MKRPIENRDDLLKSLAHGGDSHAFFSIATPYLKARYLRERSTGTSHHEAQKRILAEAAELLEKMHTVPTHRIDAWFEEHCMMLQAGQAGEINAIEADTNLNTETAAFLGTCSREILKIGSEMKRSRRQRERRFPNRLFGNRIVKTILFIAAAALLLTGAGALMVWLQFSLTVSIDAPHQHFAVRIPPVNFSDQADENADMPEDMHPPTKAAIQNDATRPDSARSVSIEQPARAPAAPVSGVNNPPPAVKRAVPPVVPKARMILPPMPPQPLDATTQPTTGNTGDPSTGTIQPSPSTSLLPSESGPGY